MLRTAHISSMHERFLLGHVFAHRLFPGLSEAVKAFESVLFNDI